MNEMEYLVSVINRIYFPDAHCNDVFWAPRTITCQKKYPGKHPGYTLYAYGGAAVSLFFVSPGQYYGNAFDEDYFKGEEKKGNEINGDFEKNIENGIEFLIGWKYWDSVLSAFRDRSFGERKRENRIAKNHSAYGGKYEIFDMESNTKTKDFAAKADMLWLSEKDGSPCISLVEYKCTDAAMKKDEKYSLSGHFSKMVKYYNKKETGDVLIQLLNRKRLLRGEPFFGEHIVQTIIVFLFSHINITRHPMYEKGVSEGNIKRRIHEMFKDNQIEFEKHIDDIAFAFIDDENADLQKMRMISAREVDFSSEETIWDSLQKVQ